jgi:hypothetical protein
MQATFNNKKATRESNNKSKKAGDELVGGY